MTARRLTFQLTPLLDLLLIVIFAQFMEVRETTQKQEQSAAVQLSAADEQLAAARGAIARLEREQQAAQADIERQQQAIAELEQSASDRAVSSGGLHAVLDALRRERDVTAAMLAELLRITPDEIEQLAGSIDDEASRESFAKMLERKLKEHSNENTSGDAVRHALKFDELSKRCDIWELHIDDTGFITLAAGDRTARFQAYSADEFERELFHQYKSQPQPKHLVLILLTHANAKAEFIQAAEVGLPRTAERMKKDQADRTRFEYAILGYNPSPLLR